MSGAAPSPEGAAGALVDHALGLSWDAVPASARQAARAFLLDTVCVGAAGAFAPHAEAVLEVARSWGEGGGCSVLGRPGARLPAAGAAFVNAFQIHGQEFDCVHEPAVLHPMSALTAALLAEAERSGPYDGASLLAAIGVGVDVAVALGLAPTTPVKFFRPATAGVFGAVAALARLRGLDRGAALDAMGYALAFASGTMQAHVEGKPALPVQVGHAARAALDAVDLAAAGLPGPQASIDGPFGYLTLCEDAVDLAPVLRDLASVRRIEQVSCKPFPTGRAAHGGLTAARALRERYGVAAADLDALVFRAPPLIKRLVGRRPQAGMAVAYARLCLPWLAAVALSGGDGEVGLGDFSPARLADPALLALAERIRVEEDGSADPAAFTPLIATATLRSGRSLEVEVSDMPGSPQHPLSEAEQMEKARRCLAFAGLEAGLPALAARLARFEDEPDAAAALRL